MKQERSIIERFVLYIWHAAVVAPLEITAMAVAFALLIVGLIVALPFVWFVELLSPDLAPRIWLGAFRGLMNFYLWSAGIGIESEGDLPLNNPDFIATNHLSIADYAIISSLYKSPIGFAGYPGNYPWPLNRYIEKASEYQTDMPVLVVSGLDGEHLDKALEENRTVLPVTLHAHDNVMSRGKWPLSSGNVRVVVHHPVKSHSVLFGDRLSDEAWCKVASALPPHHLDKTLSSACRRRWTDDWGLPTVGTVELP